jgi:pyruvate-ferredoxin/flavodoxin oxidoreductase
VPFLHFFDGFRTSHEVAKIETALDDDRAMLIDEEAIAAHRNRALTPDRPAARHAQNPDVVLPGSRGVQRLLRRLPALVQRGDGALRRAHRPPYGLFDYTAHPTPSA